MKWFPFEKEQLQGCSNVTESVITRRVTRALSSASLSSQKGNIILRTFFLSFFFIPNIAIYSSFIKRKKKKMMTSFRLPNFIQFTFFSFSEDILTTPSPRVTSDECFFIYLFIYNQSWDNFLGIKTGFYQFNLTA